MLFSPSNDRAWILTEPGSLRECALAIAIPMDRVAFDAELDGNPLVNFVLQAVGGGPGIPSRQALWEKYRPVAEAALEVAEAYGQAGAQVITPTWGEMAKAFGKCRVVTLFAHWKTADPGVPVPLDVQDVLEVLMTSGQSGPRFVRDALGVEYFRTFRPCLAGLPLEGSGVETAWDLSAKLVGLLAANPEQFPFELRGEYACRPSGRRILFASRAVEEFLVPGIYESTGRIQLADETCSRERFIEAVPSTFHGLIDLALCHSWELADFIRAQRRCHVAVAGSAVKILPRILVQKEVLKLVGKGRLSYAQALMKAYAGQKSARESIHAPPLLGSAFDPALPASVRPVSSERPASPAKNGMD